MKWEELISSNLECINIIGYWSLLNKNANSYSDTLKAVVVKWYTRIYNIKLIPSRYSVEWLHNMKKYLLKYWITTENQITELSKKNVTVLNCIKSENQNLKMNWLMMKLYKKDFVEFSKREAQYTLIKVEYCEINTSTCKELKNKGIAYIVTANEDQIISKGNHFLPYHENVRKWAYSYWKTFWKMFDDSTIL